MRGIYKITNTVNNNVYVGESLNVERRWSEHINQLNSNSHHSYSLQNDWNKYGSGCFEFNVIETLDSSIPKLIDKYVLLVLEHIYIKQHDSINNGYNSEDTFEKVASGEKVVIDGRDKRLITRIYKDMENTNWKYVSTKGAENTLVECTLKNKTSQITIKEAMKTFSKFMYVFTDGKYKRLSPLQLYKLIMSNEIILTHLENELNIKLSYYKINHKESQ